MKEDSKLMPEILYLQSEYLKWFREKTFENHNDAKRTARVEALQRNPSLRITMNFETLRRTLRYEGFYCDPDSSVAANMAVENSDVDGGVVVLERRDRRLEGNFLKQLREQGYNVVHQDVTTRGSVESLYAVQFCTVEELRQDTQVVLAGPRPWAIIPRLATVLAGHIIDTPPEGKRRIFF